MGRVQPIDTDAVLDFTHDWSDWLTDDEVISTSAWTVDPTGELTIGTVTFAPTATNTTTTVWVSGMVKGHRYELTNEIDTDSVPSRTAQRTITVRAGNR